MRNLASLFTVAVLACSLAACSSSGDDTTGDDTTTPDANTTTSPDANTGSPDAASNNNVSTQLGKICTGAQGDCPTEAPDCIAVTDPATQGFCTGGCGITPDTTTHPADGDTICAGIYDGTSGTPACMFYQTGASGVDWSCGIACCVVGTQDFGTCPNGMTCTGATAQQPGYCAP